MTRKRPLGTVIRNDPKDTCPRCKGGIPSDMHRGEYPGALSRLDNATYVCSHCGMMEALYQYAVSRDLPPIDQPIPSVA